LGVKPTGRSNNLIDIAARCMLIEDGNRLISITEWEKTTDKFFLVITIYENHSLAHLSKKPGFHKDDITDCVFMTVCI
jgi:hypothetical protein